jgi:hypothetical protein
MGKWCKKWNSIETCYNRRVIRGNAFQVTPYCRAFPFEDKCQGGNPVKMNLESYVFFIRFVRAGFDISQKLM